MRVSKKNSAAFTLLEILICLAVFSIGVFAVLRLVLSHMRMVERIQTRTVATFLAKEGLELAYARRNAHLQEGLPWNCGASLQLDAMSASLSGERSACEWLRGSGTSSFVYFGLTTGGSFIEYPLVQQDFSGIFSRSLLSIGTGATTARFARYLVFTGIILSENLLPLNKIAKIESHVLYTQGASTGEIVLESFIGGQ